MISPNSILNHFKIKEEFLKKHKQLLDFSPLNLEKVNINNHENNAIIEINNKQLIPSWGNKATLVKIPHYYREKTYSNLSKDVSNDVSLNLNNSETISFLNSSQPLNVNKFDEIIKPLIYEKYFEHKQPLFTKLPFSYNIISPNVRNLLIKLIQVAKFTRSKTKVSNFPSWPIEKSVETLRYIFLKSFEIKAKKKVPYTNFWPEKKRCCFVATHDMETETSFRNIETIREIENRFGFKSSWNVLSKKYGITKTEFNQLRQLKNNGCEIGIHGYNHDGKLPYLKREEIIKRLEHARKTFEEFNCTSFRSPQLQRNENFLHLLSDYFLCDSSVQDTDIYSAFAKKSGCCTVFPFMINDMVEVPITLAQDFRLIYTLNLNEQKMYELWKEKVDFVYEIGGVINILTHPDDYLIGNERYLKVYERLLEYIAKKESIYHDTISNVAYWWKERAYER